MEKNLVDDAVLSVEIAAFFRDAFPKASADVCKGALKRFQVIDSIQDLLKTFFPSALCAFGFGSAFEDSYRAYSDVDVVVIVPSARSLTNRCFMHRGIPMDFHVIGFEQIDNLVRIASRIGIANELYILAHGEILTERGNVARGIQEKCRLAYQAGPHARSVRYQNHFRWRLSTLVADLLVATDSEDCLAIGTALYDCCNKWIFLKNGTWMHDGKMVSRNAKRINPILSKRLYHAMLNLAGGEVSPLIAISLEILREAGGSFWAGYSEEYHFPAQ